MHAVARSGLEPICRGCNFAIDSGENQLVWKYVSNRQRNYSTVVSIHNRDSCIFSAVSCSDKGFELAKEAVGDFKRGRRSRRLKEKSDGNDTPLV